MFANPPRVSWKRSPTNLHGISRAVWEGGALSDKASKMTFDWRSRELTQRKSDRKCRNFSGFDPRPSILQSCVSRHRGGPGTCNRARRHVRKATSPYLTGIKPGANLEVNNDPLLNNCRAYFALSSNTFFCLPLNLVRPSGRSATGQLHRR